METNQKTIGDIMTGTGHENIPNVFFRMMTFVMKITDVVGNHSNRNFKRLPLKKNQIVVDYGCGPARYIKNASETVGPNGKVLAVDIHPLAIKNVKQKIKEYGLKNVQAVQAQGYSCPIPNNSVDTIYALDMFHMVEKPLSLLSEFARMIKPQGIIIIEDGHQPREKTTQKIKNSGILCIYDQNKHHVVCKLKETKCLLPTN